MKISNPTLLTLSLITKSSLGFESKKVPPRNPTDRIKTLNRFTQSWLTKIIAIKYVRPIRAHRMSQTFTRHVEKLETAYQRCGFYDTGLPNGGPKPNGKNSKALWNDFISGRKNLDEGTTRSLLNLNISSASSFNFFGSLLSNFKQTEGGFLEPIATEISNHRITEGSGFDDFKGITKRSSDIFDENSDAFDQYEMNLSNGLAIRNADAELERLLNTNYEPAEAWKKITTGYIKWIYRYLGECNNYQNHIDRFTKVNIRLNEAFSYLENLSS